MTFETFGQSNKENFSPLAKSKSVTLEFGQDTGCIVQEFMEEETSPETLLINKKILRFYFFR